MSYKQRCIVMGNARLCPMLHKGRIPPKAPSTGFIEKIMGQFERKGSNAVWRKTRKAKFSLKERALVVPDSTEHCGLTLYHAKLDC